jgi:hypothetical protein
VRSTTSIEETTRGEVPPSPGRNGRIGRARSGTQALLLLGAPSHARFGRAVPPGDELSGCDRSEDRHRYSEASAAGSRARMAVRSGQHPRPGWAPIGRLDRRLGVTRLSNANLLLFADFLASRPPHRPCSDPARSDTSLTVLSALTTRPSESRKKSRRRDSWDVHRRANEQQSDR